MEGLRWSEPPQLLLMIFRHSAVTALTRDTVTESASSLPLDIHPALVGSGRLALSLDATGMQGLNTFMGHYPDGFSLEHTSWLNEKHLHLYRDRALSAHYAAEVDRGLGFNNPHHPYYSLLPLGWMEYVVEIDGVLYRTDDLKNKARDWKREFTPREGLLTTAFSLEGVRLSWMTVPLLDKPVAPFQLTVTSLDGKEHQVRVTVCVRIGLRNGTPLMKPGNTGYSHGSLESGAWMEWTANSETSAREVMEPVTIRWSLGLAGGEKAAAVTGDEEGISVNWQGMVPAQKKSAVTTFVLVLGIDADKTHRPEYAAKYLNSSGRKLMNQGRQSWSGWFAEGMDVWLGDPEREYLQACAQYTLRAGTPWDQGCPLGTLWTQKFGAMTFWDTFFSCDGLLRTGHQDEVRRFGNWCVKTARKKGRPHFWMTWHNGIEGSHPDLDKGYQSTLSFAQSIIRLAEVSGSDEDKSRRSLPYLRRLAAYVLDEVLESLPDGTWRMKGEVAHDVGVENLDPNQQPVMLAWVLSCLGKFVEYSQSSGTHDSLVAQAEKATTHFRERTEKINLTRGIWNTWAVNLTQSQPFADIRGWADWMASEFARVPLRGQLIMPWLNGNEAVSLAISGQPSLGLYCLDQTHDHVSGLGYLGESLWEFKCGGNTPYVPSSGVYLSSIAAMICTGSIWSESDGSREVWFGPNIPERWRHNRFRWQNVTTLNGVRTSGDYTPSGFVLKFESHQPVVLRVSVPPRIEGAVMKVSIDGKPVEFTFDPTATTPQIRVSVPAGQHEVSVCRDEVVRPDILLWEPSVHGRALQKILEGTGRSVMRLCESATITDWIGKTKTLVYDLQYVATRVDHVQALEQAMNAGLNLVLLNHAVCRRIDPRLAVLSGVNAEHDRDYQYEAFKTGIRLTEAGRRQLPGVPESFQTWMTMKITPNPAADVEVWATLEDGQTAAVTHRKLGRGSVSWMCMGEKLMDRNHPEASARSYGLKSHYTESGGAALIVYGTYPDEMSVPRWITEPGFEELLRALASV